MIMMNEFTTTAVSLDDWKQLAEASMKGRSLDSLERSAEDGLVIKALYTALDRPDELPQLGSSGWRIAQEIEPASTAAALNAAILAELTGGAQEINLPADQDPGLLPDALDGVVLEAMGFGFAPGGDWRAVAIALGRISERMSSPLSGTIGADPALALVAGQPAEAAMAEADAVACWIRETPAMRAVDGFAIAGDHYHLLGLGPAAELATILTSTVFALRRMEAAGIAPDDALKRMRFRLAAEADLYGSIAKTRAALIVLGQLAEAVGASSDGIEARLHGVTSARHLTRLDTDTNILRNGTALLGLVLGGAGIITARPHDWLTGSTEEGRRLARGGHHLMAAEARLDQVADPAAGAYFIEHLTRDLAACAWSKFQEIESLGGIANAAATITAWAEQASTARQAAVNDGRDTLLGVTIHAARSSAMAEVLPLGDGLRGGAHRPAADWEALRASVAGMPLRCLLLDIDVALTAAPCQRWFQAVGVEAAHLKVEGKVDALAALASAAPAILVVGSPDDAIVEALEAAAPEGCTVVNAQAFAGDKLALMRQLLARS